MRNLPWLPIGKRESSKKGCCHPIGKHPVWCGTASQFPAPAGHTTIWAWAVPSATICIWLSHGAVTRLMSGGYPNYLQQILQRQPQWDLCCAKPHTNLQQETSARMAPRCKTAHGKQIQQTQRVRGEEHKQGGKRNTSMFCVTSFLHPPGPKTYSGFPLCITSANNQHLLSAAWSTKPSVWLEKLHAE